jgi:hypothetical protein
MIVEAYTTPAQRIVKLLISLKHNLSEISSLDLPQVERELNFAINKITERKIFTTDHNEHRQSLSNIIRRPSVLKKKNQMINWLDEYSDSKSQNFVPAVKRQKRHT